MSEPANRIEAVVAALVEDHGFPRNRAVLHALVAAAIRAGLAMREGELELAISQRDAFKQALLAVTHAGDPASQDWYWCNLCGGQGRLADHPCDRCKGTGKVLAADRRKG